MTATGCAVFRDVAPELALGIAVGDERAAALEHLERCARCRRELRELTGSVDALLLAAPVAEPEAGFETRVLQRFAATAEPTPRRGRRVGRRVAAAAAAVLLLLVGGVAAVDHWHDGRPAGSPSAPERASGVLRSPGGSAVGTVSVDRTSTTASRYVHGASLVVALSGSAPSGTYRVQCDYASGQPYTAGTLSTGGPGAERWTAEVTVPTDDLRRVRLVSTSGGANLEAEIPS